MFTRGQRIYDVISQRYGEFFSWSNTGRSAWVRMDGDISIICSDRWHLLAADSPKVEISKKRNALVRGGVKWEDLDVHVVFALMVNE